MYADLSLRKIYMLSFIIVAIAVCTVTFFVANSTWLILPQAKYLFSRTLANVEFDMRYASLTEGVHSLSAQNISQQHAISIPVLLYHGESGGPDMPQSVFVDQMRALKAAGWQTITMQQFEDWEQGKVTLPAKSFLLTFDDGRTDTYFPVDPVLKSLGFHAVMFVITGFSLPADGKPISFYLDKTDLANMLASGRWDLESHGNQDHALYKVQTTTDLTQSASTTTGHFLSNKFWDPSTNAFETNAQYAARVTNDLETAKQKLQQTFGISVDAFAYPFNDYGQDSVNFPGSVSELQSIVPSVYSFAFYQWASGDGDTFNYPETGFQVKRIEPLNDWTGADLLAHLQAGSAKPLPYQSSSFDPASGWHGTWGNVSATAEGLSLAATKNTTGASALLNGSGWWSDVDVNARIDWQSGQSVSLLGRTNGTDAVMCAFTDSGAALKLVNKSGNETLARATHAFTQDPSNANFSMQIAGDSATCLENGVPVVSGSSLLFPAKGGVGIEIWDVAPGAAASVVRSVSVQSDASTTPAS